MFVGSFAVIYVILYLFIILMANASVVLQLVGSWFAFKKMGLPGWKGIIPYYSTYVLFDKLWETKKFWRMIIYLCVYAGAFLFGYIFLAVGIALAAATDSASGVVFLILGVLLLIGSVVMLVLTLVIEYQLFKKFAHAFGLKDAWAWGLLFIPYVMLMIIGFHKRIVYYGPVNQVQ